MAQDVKHATRAGFVALIGAPNAGKSTLLNAVVGTKVSIVTHKVQTTRALIRGIVIHGTKDGRAQIVFVDTPGIFRPKRRLERAMVTTAWGGAADADVVALLIDAKRGLTDEDRAIIEKLAEFPAERERVLLLNKVDLVKRETLLAACQGGERGGALLAHLHDLGADRRRRLRSSRPSRRRDAGGSVPLSGGPDDRPAAALPRGGDHARKADAPAA